MSRQGDRLHNAPMESVRRTLKTERGHHRIDEGDPLLPAAAARHQRANIFRHVPL
jgi:transposase InsO family protein